MGRLLASGVAALAMGCGALPATQPTAQPSIPAPTGSPASALPTAASGCSAFVVDDEVGSGQTFGGAGFLPDVPLTLSLDAPDGPTFTEADFAELRSDARGAFELHLFASRADIGTHQLEVKGAGCVARADVEVRPERFPVAACEPLAVLPPSGGAASDDYAAAVLADDPLAYWRFEEADGITTADSAGGESGHLEENALLGQAGAIDGSRAVMLAGLGDRVSVPRVELSGDFTIEAWIRLCGENIVAFDALAGQGNEGPDINFAGWRARLAAGREDVLESSVEVDREHWMHLAVTRHGDDLTLYQQAAKVAEGTWAGTFTISALGAGSDGRGTLEAWLDEVAVYDHALTAEVIGARAAALP